MVDYLNAYGSIAEEETETNETLDLVDVFSTITSNDVGVAFDNLFGEPCAVEPIKVSHY